MTSQADPRRPKCAFCEKWDGDANLTNQGVAKGLVRFNSAARGVCLAGQGRNTKIANEGANCSNYDMSIKAKKYT